MFKLNNLRFLFDFERLIQKLKSSEIRGHFNSFKLKLSSLAHTYFLKSHNLRFSSLFFSRSDVDLLRGLGSNSELIISRPDKGSGVVLMDRSAYNDKMYNILNDVSKFIRVNDDPLKMVFRLEDRLNRFIAHLKENKTIDDSAFSLLHATGSN